MLAARKAGPTRVGIQKFEAFQHQRPFVGDRRRPRAARSPRDRTRASSSGSWRCVTGGPGVGADRCRQADESPSSGTGSLRRQKRKTPSERGFTYLRTSFNCDPDSLAAATTTPMEAQFRRSTAVETIRFLRLYWSFSLLINLTHNKTLNRSTMQSRFALPSTI